MERELPVDTQDYITIPLSKRGKSAGKYEVKVNLEDADLSSYNWSARISSTMPYAQYGTPKRYGEKRYFHMHRVILERMIGRKLKKHEVVDHINHDSLDNRRSNLRVATVQQNAQNMRLRVDSSTGYKGVYNHSKGGYVAQIWIDKKHKYLGYFQTPELAHEAYCKAAKEHFGEFANTGD